MAQTLKPNFQGKVSLVVGGTSGIGKGFCEWLAMHGASVVVAGRNKQSGAEVIELMKKVAPRDLSPAPQYAFLPIDCFLISDTRRFAAEFQQQHPKLDYLVLSPGIATTQGRTETSEGVDQKLAVHYFSRMAVIDGLLPVLEKTAAEEGADVRVLSVFSGGVHSSYNLYKEDPEVKQNYTLKNAADASGMYNDIGLDSFSREHPKISFTHAAPGFVSTNWGTEMSFPLRMLIRSIQVFGKSPLKCAEILGHSLYAPDFKGGFHVMSASGTHDKVTSIHEQAREPVWQTTRSLLDRFPGPTTSRS